VDRRKPGKIEKALQMYVELWKIFVELEETKKAVIYVPGNHDSLPFARLVYKVSPFQLGSIRLTHKYDIDDRKQLIFPYYVEGNLWVEHGHRFDKYNRESSQLAGGSKGLLGKFVAKMVGVAEKVISKDIDEKLWEVYESASETFRSLKAKFTHRFYKVADNLQSYVTPSSNEYRGDFSEYEKGAHELGDRLLGTSHESSRVFVI